MRDDWGRDEYFCPEADDRALFELSDIHYKDISTMGLNVSSKGGQDFTPLSAGNHGSRCIHVVDLGTQKSEWKGKKKENRQVMFCFEIPGEKRDDNGEPRQIWTRRFTANIGEQAALRPFLESWRGSKFSEGELDSFSLVNVLDKTGLVNVIHETKEGKTRAKISGVTQMPKGMVVPKAHAKPSIFDIENATTESFSALPEWVRSIIAESVEVTGGKVTLPAVIEAAGGNGDDNDDDIPF